MDTERYVKCSALVQVCRSEVEICCNPATQWYIGHYRYLIPRCAEHATQYVSPVYYTLEEGLAALAMERL